MPPIFRAGNLRGPKLGNDHAFNRFYVKARLLRVTLIHTENAMTHFTGAQTQAKKFTNQNDLSSDAQEVRENVKDLGDSVGHMASRQYERAQDMATDAIQETGDAIQHNPLTAIAIGLGVGFLFGRAMGGRH